MESHLRVHTGGGGHTDLKELVQEDGTGKGRRVSRPAVVDRRWMFLLKEACLQHLQDLSLSDLG